MKGLLFLGMLLGGIAAYTIGYPVIGTLLFLGALIIGFVSD